MSAQPAYGDHPASDSESPECRYCGAETLRRSRFRLHDVPWLLLMGWPVRCLACGKRQRLPLWQARLAKPSSTPHAIAAPGTGWLDDSAVLEAFSTSRNAPSKRPPEGGAS